MKSHRHSESRELSRAQRLLKEQTPEQRAADHRTALRWRKQLRAGTIDAAAEMPEAVPGDPRDPEDREARQRAAFAVGIARAEFGRFYWKAPPVDKRRGNGVAQQTPSRAAPKSSKLRGRKPRG